MAGKTYMIGASLLLALSFLVIIIYFHNHVRSDKHHVDVIENVYPKNLRRGGMQISDPKYFAPNRTQIDNLEDIESCRTRSLQVLTGQKLKTNKAMEEARQCWEQHLVYYLSYPVDFGFGSHGLPLVACLWVSQGSILELGSGWHSTPITHRIAVQHKRYTLTVDSKYEWLQYFVFFASDLHHLTLITTDMNMAVDAKVRLVNSWEEIGGDRHWGLIFVDQAPASQRRLDLLRLRNNGDLLLVHDSEGIHDNIYGLEKPLESFKHRATFGPGWTGTFSDVVSDTNSELVSAVKILNQWSIELLDRINYPRRRQN